MLSLSSQFYRNFLIKFRIAYINYFDQNILPSSIYKVAGKNFIYKKSKKKFNNTNVIIRNQYPVLMHRYKKIQISDNRATIIIGTKY